jgi:hypothetical protein
MKDETMMSKSVLYMSMSLDGFITGLSDDTEHGLGVGGERVGLLTARTQHCWPRSRHGGGRS